MTTITFDTLKFMHRLRDAGMPEPQAEAVAEAFKEASGEALLVTKPDIDRLEAKIDAGKAEVMAELRLNRWMSGLLLAGVMSLILKAFF